MTRGETFESDGVCIAYDDVHPEEGEGEPIVLVHGFASNRRNNWSDQGWYDVLLEHGRRVIALDNRGHGDSEKRHDPSVYEIGKMAADVVNLLDHLEVDVADLFGYSMGGRIAVELVQRHPERINAAVIGGIGDRITSDTLRNREEIARALEADGYDDIDLEIARDFRLFAERMGGDLDALAAVIRAHGSGPPDLDLASVDLPVLIAAGETDEIAGDPTALAAMFANGEAAVIAGQDHVTTVPHEDFVAGVVDFLDREGL